MARPERICPRCQENPIRKRNSSYCVPCAIDYSREYRERRRRHNYSDYRRRHYYNDPFIWKPLKRDYKISDHPRTDLPPAICPYYRDLLVPLIAQGTDIITIGAELTLRYGLSLEQLNDILAAEGMTLPLSTPQA